MKVGILAAGIGSRLQPYTNDKPKALLEINKTTMIGNLIKQLKDNNLKDFVIIVGHEDKKLINYLRNTFPKDHFKFIYNSNYYNMNNIYSFYLLKPYVLNEDLILANSDLICEDAIVELLAKSPLNTVMVDNKKKLNEESMKILINDKGHISQMGKELIPSASYGEYIGLLKLSHDRVSQIMETVGDFIHKGEVNVWYENAINKDLRILELLPISTSGHQWFEIDTHEDYSSAIEIFGL